MNKKKSLFGIAFGVILLKILPFISAFDPRSFFETGVNQVVEGVEGFTAPFFEVLLNTSAYEDFFFAKCLLLILLFVVIVFVIDKAEIFGKVKRKPFVIYTISAIVSILGMRYLPESDLIKGILLPYSALGIAITTFLPLVIYFFFIHNSGFEHFGRRAGWALYGIIFLALWWSKGIDLSGTSSWIYWGAIVFVLLSFIFDTSIHKYFQLSDFRRFTKESKFWTKLEIKDKMEKLMKAMQEGSITQTEYDKELQILEERYKELM